jgi:hypothetical protein
MAKAATRRAPLKLDEMVAAKPGAVAPIRKPVNKASDGRRGQTLRLDVENWKRLKKLAVDEETTAHALMIEALNLLFKDRGLPPIG